MKKILLASTALFAFSAVSAYAADPVQLSIGGFMRQEVIYVGNATYDRMTNVDQQGFGQVNFTGSTKLDNGLTVGVAVETLATQWNDSRNASGTRYADGNGATTNTPTGGQAGIGNSLSSSRASGNSDVRRAYLTVTSGFGQVILGQREDYGFIAGLNAPDVAWGLEAGDWTNVAAWPSSHAVYLETNNSRYTNRRDKITVISPTLAGFSVGVTYAPDIRQSWTGDLDPALGFDGVSSSNYNPTTITNADYIINRAEFSGDFFLEGISYTNTIAGIGLKGNFDAAQYNMANLKTYEAGFQAAFGGFTLGGSAFARNIGSNDHVFTQNVAGAYTAPATINAAGTAFVYPSAQFNNSASNAMMHTGLNWAIGGAYAIDAYSFSLGYFHDSSKRDASSGAVGGTNITAYGGAADSTQAYALGFKYVMGPGVDFRTSVVYFDLKNNSNVAVNTPNRLATEDSGIAVLTGVQVAF